MANKTVSNLNELTTVSNSDVLLVETETETLKVTKGNLLKEVNEQLSAKAETNHTHENFVTEEGLNRKKYATENYVDDAIANAQLGQPADILFNDKIVKNGRWFIKSINDVNYLTSIYMGSKLYFRFSNTENFKINFGKINTAHAVSYSLDNSNFVRLIIVDDTINISLTGLAKDEEHDLILIVEDIVETERVWTTHGGVLVKSFEMDADGILAQYQNPRSKVLFLGDSITAGLSVKTGVQPNSGLASGNYVARLCELMKWVDIRWAFGYSGIQAVSPFGIPCVMDYFNWMANGYYDYNEEFPEYIFINYGTNDSLQSIDTTVFKEKFVQLVGLLKRKFIDVPIIVLIPFGGYYKDHINEALAGISNLYICDITSDFTPSAIHPNETESVTIANLIKTWFDKTFTSSSGAGDNSDPTPSDVEVQSISLSTDTKELATNGSFKLTATLNPSDATNQNVTWSVDNANVSIVPDGLTCTVIGDAIGDSIVTVKSQSNPSVIASCKVRVVSLDEQITWVEMGMIANNDLILDSLSEDGNWVNVSVYHTYGLANTAPEKIIYDLPTNGNGLTTEEYQNVVASDDVKIVNQTDLGSATEESGNFFAQAYGAFYKNYKLSATRGTTQKEIRDNIRSSADNEIKVRFKLKDAHVGKVGKLSLNGGSDESYSFVRTETADSLKCHVITVEKANAINDIANVISYVHCPNKWIGYLTSSSFQIRIPIERFPDANDSTIRTELAAHPIDIYYYIP